MPQTTGIVVYRASRLEALLDPFETLRRSASVGEVLRPTRVVAAHPGIQRWMIGALARRAGLRGVVANLDVRLPSQWLDELAVTVLGEASVSLAPYRREALRWRILDTLPRVDHAALRAYLLRSGEQCRDTHDVGSWIDQDCDLTMWTPGPHPPQVDTPASDARH